MASGVPIKLLTKSVNKKLKFAYSDVCKASGLAY